MSGAKRGLTVYRKILPNEKYCIWAFRKMHYNCLTFISKTKSIKTFYLWNKKKYYHYPKLCLERIELKILRIERKKYDLSYIKTWPWNHREIWLPQKLDTAKFFNFYREKSLALLMKNKKKTNQQLSVLQFERRQILTFSTFHIDKIF